MSSESCRCGEPVGQSAVWVGRRLFCSPECYDFWSSGRDMQALERIDALEASNDANLAMLKEAKRMLDLREAQLADCTRAMRVAANCLAAIATDVASYGSDEDWEINLVAELRNVSRQLDDARAGK